MEETNMFITNIEEKIKVLNNKINNIRQLNTGQKIVVITTIAILVLTLIIISWRARLLLLAALVLMGFIIYSKIKLITPNDSILMDLSMLKEKLIINENKTAEMITELNKKLDKALEDLNNENASAINSDKLLKSPYKALLEMLQSLDTESIVFGDKCNSSIHDKISKSFDRCGLRFVDYSTEYADCYNISFDPEIDDVEYLKKAVMDKETNHVLLKGIVFLPIK